MGQLRNFTALDTKFRNFEKIIAGSRKTARSTGIAAS
jgi:hypothetical protein